MTAIQSATIGDIQFGVIPNPLKGKSALDQVIEWIKTPGSDYRFFKSMDEYAKLGSLVSKELESQNVALFDDVSSKAGLTAGMLGLRRLPELTKNAWTALVVGAKDEGRVVEEDGKEKRVLLQNVRDVTEAAAAWLYAVALFASKPTATTAKELARVPDLVTNVADLAKNGQDLILAKKYRDSIPEDAGQIHKSLRQRFSDKMTGTLLSMTKGIISVVTAVFAMLSIALSPATLVAAGCISTTAALASHFFMATRECKEVQFFKPTAERNADNILVF